MIGSGIFFELQEILAINILKFCYVKTTSNPYQLKFNFEAKWRWLFCEFSFNLIYRLLYQTYIGCVEG